MFMAASHSLDYSLLSFFILRLLEQNQRNEIENVGNWEKKFSFHEQAKFVPAQI